MTATLRPMSLGEILDRTIQIYRSRFSLFAALASIPALAMMALQFVNLLWWKLTPASYGPRIFFGLTPEGLVYMVAFYQIALLLHILAWPAFAYLTSRLYLGEQPTLSSAFFWCVARWRSWLWMTIASWGAVLVLPEAVFSGIFIGTAYILFELLKLDSVIPNEWGPPALMFTVEFGWVAFLWLSAALSLAIPAWTLEGLTTGKSLRRGWTLSKGGRWHVFFARFMPAFIGWLLNLALSWTLLLSVFWIMRTFRIWWYFGPSIYAGVGYFSGAAASTLVGPLFPIALTLIYYDQRIRREGYDIERMMEAAGLDAPITPPGGVSPSAPAEAGEAQA
jgi:hypothetical protein